MKKIIKATSIILSLVMLMQSTVLADKSPVIIEKVTGNNRTTVFQGALPKCFSSIEDDFEYGLILDWEAPDNIYVIKPQKNKSEGNVKGDKRQSVKQIDTEAFPPISGININDEILNINSDTVIFTDNEVPDGFNVIDYEAEENVVNEIPSIRNGEASSEISLLSNAADEVTATSFNTVIAPSAVNGINEPKFSSAGKSSEEISGYSGELTLRYNDLTLDGRNGLDLNIGRIYQTSQACLGQMKYMAAPTENGIQAAVLWDPANYYLDRYNLGAGWAFSFPSVQVINEYEYDIIEDYGPEIRTYTELYYHTGNGAVYQVEFTSDENDSNLKGYYKKDIQFNQDDTGYSNGVQSSYYSMTLADKTKQYFARDGRLLGICDRFGNEIKFEHIMKTTTNYIPNSTFAYDNDMWTLSEDNAFEYMYDFGRYDDRSIQFNGYVSGRSYILSQAVQVDPGAEYELSLSLNSKYDDNVKVIAEEYDWGYNYYTQKVINITDLPAQEWTERVFTINPDYFTRYIRIRIEVDGGTKDLYIDNVCFDSQKPLISQITDSIGRVVNFTYTGNILADSTGSVTIDVTAPDGNTKKLEYAQKAVEYVTDFVGKDDQRFYWYLDYSDTEGELYESGTNASRTTYYYEGGMDSDGYIKLHTDYNSKTLRYPNSYYNKPVISKVKYRNRTTNYEYEPTRKNLGKKGFYDSLRIVKRYDQYAYMENDNTKFGGRENLQTFSYSGIYEGVSYSDETGYPNYEFTNETTSGEKWVTETIVGDIKAADTFSNGALIKSEETSLSDNVKICNEYIYHDTFKNEPVQEKTTVIDGTDSQILYTKYDYNSWGGLSEKSKQVPDEIFLNQERFEKYITSYEYDDNFKFPTAVSYYNDEAGSLLREVTQYDTLGRVKSFTDASGKKINYLYENTAYPYLVTCETVSDPQGLHYLMGEARTVSYQYDSFGLYATSVSENYDGKSSVTAYSYEYIYGNLLKQTNPDGGVFRNIYDAQGRILQASQPYMQDNGSIFYYVDVYSYKPRANYELYGIGLYQYEKITRYAYYPASSQQLRCSTVIKMYDNDGNCRMEGNVDYANPVDNLYPMNVTKYYFDSLGRTSEVIDCGNVSEKYSYDAFNRIIDIEKNGINYVYEYDDIERSVLSYYKNAQNVESGHIKQQYDAWGNVLSREVYPSGISSAGISESFAYDISGNVISNTNPNGNITTYNYDNLSRLAKIVLPNGTYVTTKYNYFNKPVSEKVFDSQGNEIVTRTSLSNEKGNTTAKFYAWDNRLRYNNSYEYSAKGNVAEQNEGCNTYSYVYDFMDNQLEKSNGESVINKRYSPFGLRIAAANDGSVATSLFTYDAMGRVAQKRQNNYGGTLSYEYNTKNMVSDITTPLAVQVGYSYDSNDRLSTITAENGNFTYTYNDSGMVKSVAYPNGIMISYQYDNANRVTSVITQKDNNVISSLTYTYDNNGNILTENDGNKIVVYTYDNMDRLKTANYGDSDTVTYEYDAANNRTKEIHTDGTIKDYVYDSTYRLIQVKTNGSITDSYEYNQAGAVTRHNDTLYTYNQWGKLLSVANGDDLCYYKYDADGIRTAKGDIQYFTDLNGNVVTECGTDGTAYSETVYGNQALARKVGTSWYYYLYNAHGDVIGLTDSNGNIVNSYRYDAWGNTIEKTETIENPVRYAGQYFDDELGMYYLRARYYDPTIGRFTSVDSVEGSIYSPLDMNQYVYCRNNPNYYGDINGEKVYIIGSQLAGQLGIRLGVSKGIIFDEHYNVAKISEFSFGGGLDVGVSLGGFLAIIDTEYISDVSGGSFEIGGSVSPIKVGPLSLGAGYDFTVSLGENKKYGDIYSVNAALGVLPADGHGQLSYTFVYSRWYTIIATVLLKLLK